MPLNSAAIQVLKNQKAAMQQQGPDRIHGSARFKTQAAGRA
jgi:hypothetical protein